MAVLMCYNDIKNTSSEKISFLESKIKEVEGIALKIKSMKFENFHSFDFVHKNFKEGEVYSIEGVGHTVITKKSLLEVCFVVFMDLHNIWNHHFQDVDKHLVIKQGVYLDLYTGKEYNDQLTVKAFQPSHFQAVGNKSLIIKGRVYK